MLKKMKSISVFGLCILLLALLVSGCGGSDDSTATKGTRSITDSLGRTVEIPEKVEKILGMSGALRYVCYLDAADMVVGIEEIEQKNTINRPYSFVYKDLSTLPVVGNGGSGGATAYEEEIIKAAPDVIIAGYDQKMADDVQSKTGIPVVAVTIGSVFEDSTNQSLTLMGDILGKEDRAKEVVDYMEKCKTDLNDRTKGIADDKKPTVYTGAVSFKGSHGIEGTYGEYPPFVAINAKNVVDETGKGGAMIIDKEKILEWDPEVLFLNPDSLNLVNEDAAANPDFYAALQAVKNKKVYSQLSYNWYYSNIELAIADAYYAGTVIYPDAFKDIKITEKADEIYEKFLGQKLNSEFEAKGQSFGPVTIGE